MDVVKSSVKGPLREGRIIKVAAKARSPSWSDGRLCRPAILELKRRKSNKKNEIIFDF